MFSNLLGFDVEAELRCAKTRHWIKQEEKRVKKAGRDYNAEKSDEDLREIEAGEEASLMDIFHNSIKNK